MKDAFQDQVVALIPRLRAYAMSLAGSSAEADDIVQEALMRAWRFRDGYQMGTNLRAWLYRIVRNAFYTHAAKRKDTVEDVDGRWAATLSCTPEQEWRVQYGELLRALRQLSPEARDALLLVVSSGLSYQEAAEICGCAVGTMKSRVNRARSRLARLMDLDPDEPSRPSAQSSRSLVA
ncbi:sigma-70 family RNA polymerase sigma factor [Phenylobacterium sp.]|uniref:sigma-70 family RNA polymerase sigma factor n=1 Tax=Phenylobacterium sp. TaxID=1871053 RepID=UPI0035B2630F